MKNLLLIKSIILTIFVAAFIGATVFAMRPNYVGIRAGKADENYVPSDECKSCHESNFASWNETFHSRMTQEATPESIQGDFNNQTFEYLGVKSKMERRGNDFFMLFDFPDGRKVSNKIERTIGSRRIQQYLAKENGNYIRLPIAWDIEQKRWMSLNGSFFYPDGDNFFQHKAQWDLNCVFCHNVKAQPNYDFAKKQAKTEVAELGIACGACHGAGAEHASSASNPITRAVWENSETDKKHIVLPTKLDSDKSLMVCGHCHGQRVPEPESRIQEILTKGDPFDAGEDLSKFYRSVHQETRIGNVSFAARFWADGSIRLTAYEYQGVLRSPCFAKSKAIGKGGATGEKINCLSCHTMHEGDVHGQITEEKRTNLACTQCHQEFSEQAALQEHTKHQPNSTGNSCYACHMPEVVYGVQTFHRTHETSVPNPELTATKAVPNACNACHIDKSVNWAIDKTKTLWAERFRDSKQSSDTQFDIAEGGRALFAGDALTRAWAAFSLTKNSDPSFFTPLLAESFANENYPIVRYFTANGLEVTHWDLPKPDYLANSETRQQQISQWFTKIDPTKREEVRKTADELRKKRTDSDLEVGE